MPLSAVLARTMEERRDREVGVVAGNARPRRGPGVARGRDRELAAKPRPPRQSLTFGEIAERWWAGVERGTIGKRRGTGDPYSDTTCAGYGRDLHGVLIPEFGARPAQDVSELEWQTWIDGLRDAGLSRSRIANLLAVASAIYGWAARPTRKLVPRNPVRLVELPPRDEKPRTRVASVARGRAATRRPASRRCHALRVALYAGLRRQEIHRLRWQDLDLGRHWLTVQKSKSEAGTGRRVPLAEPLAQILLASADRHGSAPHARVAKRFGHVGKAGGASYCGMDGSRPATHHAPRVSAHLRFDAHGLDTEVDTRVSQRARAARNSHETMPEEGLEPPTRGL